MSFECHITLRLKDGKTPIVQSIAKANGWKTSEIARDPILGDDTFFYLTAQTGAACGTS